MTEWTSEEVRRAARRAMENTKGKTVADIIPDSVGGYGVRALKSAADLGEHDVQCLYMYSWGVVLGYELGKQEGRMEERRARRRKR